MENPFSGDPYLRQHHARSILCLPLINRAKLIGVLYLENHLTPHVFTPARIAVLKLLASQAAISLENTRLYSDLQEREARIRRLVDANIIGIFIWNLDGRILEANDAFLRMVGYDREDLVSGRVRWRELTPDEWRAADDQALAELAATGICEPFEKEYVRKDGSRVPVLVGAALFEGRRDEGVAFVLDLTERKRAEEALHQAQAELAHVTRVATLGELTASIAHEINQPLGAVVNNASACVRWLAAQNLEEARQSAARVIADGHRAARSSGGFAPWPRRRPRGRTGSTSTTRSGKCSRWRRAKCRGIGVSLRDTIGRRPAAGVGGPDPVAAGDAESADERHRGPEWGRRGATRAVGELGQRRGGGGRDHRARFGPGVRSAAPRPAVRRLLHDEAGRPGDGARDQPLDRGEPRRPAVGDGQYAHWRRFSSRCRWGAKGRMMDTEALGRRRRFHFRGSCAGSACLSPSRAGP